MTNDPQQKAALEAMGKAVDDAIHIAHEYLAHVDGSTRERGLMLTEAAIGRLREATLLFNLALAKPFSFETHHALDSLKNVLHTTHDLANEEVNQMGPGGDLIDIDDVEDLLAAHETALQALVQAEISSSCALLHLHTALSLVDTRD